MSKNVRKDKKIFSNIIFGLVTFIILTVLMVFGVSEENINKIRSSLNEFTNNNNNSYIVENDFTSNIDENKELLLIDFIDVGQADCILIRNNRRVYVD